MAVARKDIGEIMVEKGWISPSDLQQARQMQQQSRGTDLGRILIDNGMADERDVANARATSLNMRFVDLDQTKPAPEAIAAIPAQTAQRHNLIPVMKKGSDLLVAISDPTADPTAADDVRLASGCRVTFAIAAPSAIEDAISASYGGSSDGATSVVASSGNAADLGGMAGSLTSVMGDVEAYKGRADVSEDEDAEDVPDAPIIRVANVVVQQAIRDKASDIHIEPDRHSLRVRYRVDGVLQEVMTLPKYIHPPLISRFKIMANMNIAERRLPLDGRIAVAFENKEYDLRVSSLPTLHGEKVVMRILDKSSVLIGLNKIGFLPEVQAQMESIITQPNGMILMTGPTGSGKTTTLYSILHKISNIEVNILTVEDPVEYQLPGISQVHVNRKAGLTFATALRSFLRQDPDIIMVGEMRDLETAEIGIEASLTGHLVLSTLHTNDAPSAVTRLVDMGVEPYLISATIIGVLAQRLARTICSSCKVPYEVPAHELRHFGYRPESENEMVQLWRGQGCDVCKGKGLKGRTGVHEMMLMNDEIADLVVRRAPVADVREAARANGMLLLREDGLRKILEGVTTPEEIRRVVFTAG
ncbi:MAG: GspE/PulE family protein, partial [Armatimonadetes bacterium]|nr:GspE/PulE family protein [Armatimonadota bacterium]